MRGVLYQKQVSRADTSNFDSTVRCNYLPLSLIRVSGTTLRGQQSLSLYSVTQYIQRNMDIDDALWCLVAVDYIHVASDYILFGGPFTNMA